MPLLRDNAHPLALVKHGINVIAKSTEHVNHGLVPVLSINLSLLLQRRYCGLDQMSMVKTNMLL